MATFARIKTVCMLCAFAANVAQAQVPPPAPSPALPSTLGNPTALPVIAPARELKGAALVEALRQGGYVLYMRHAMQIAPKPGTCEGSNLTPAGEEQARTVGRAIRALKVPVGRVLSSEPCRNRDTSRLLGLGEYEITIDLNPVGSQPGVDFGAARTARLAEMPRGGTNTVLVSHVHGSRKKSEWLHLELAEIIVHRPDGQGGAEAVARVRVEGWGELMKAVGVGGK
ncbi:MAG: hypothetical protein ABI790_03780 [Betaproteobacteria bacterium]